LTYRVLTARKVREQLKDAPPELRGYVDDVVALLRVEPTAASVAFLYQVFEEQRVVVLVDLVWL
jgi:hypothetical protein